MGVTLLLAALLCQAPVDAAQPADQTVSEVELRLHAGASPRLLDEAPGLVLVRKGQQLSVRAVRRSIERLMESGKFADVEAVAEVTPEGLRVIFELQGRQVIGSVYVEGGKRISRADVLAAAKLPHDSEFYPERLAQAREAVLQAYRRHGYRDARVEVRAAEGEVGVDVGFIVDEGPPTRLKGVVVSGDPGLPLPRLMHELNLELNGVIDLGEVEAGLEHVRETLKAEHFYRARVDPPQVEASGLLVLPIAAGPRVTLGFVGNRAFASHALLSVLAWDGSEVLDRTAADRLVQRLTAFYRYRGFHEVRITAVDEPGREPRSAVLSFVIDEGPQLVVRAVELVGNRGISTDELKQVLVDVIRSTAPDPGSEVHALSDPLQVEGRTATARVAEVPDPAPQTVLVEAAYLEATKAMARLYRERGFLNPKVTLDQIEITRSGATVRFVIEEGPQTRLRKVLFVGGPSGFPESRAQAMAIGEPFGERRLELWRQALARELAHRGFLYGNVESQVQLEDDATQADLVFRAMPGPKVTVGKVLVRGNQRTEESVVRSRLTLKEGEALDPELMLTSQRNLLGLGVFRSVDVHLLNPDAHDAVKDLVVELRERPRLSGEFGLGYFYADGPRFVVDAEYPNVAGRAINLQARLKLNYFGLSAPALTGQVDIHDLSALEQFGGLGNLSVSNRGLLPFDIGARVDLVGERTFRPGFRFTRAAAVPGIDWSHTFNIPFIDWTRPKLTLQLQYEVEGARVTKNLSASDTTFVVTRADQERLRFLAGTFVLHTVRFAPTIDLRDDVVVPRKGLLLQTAIESTFPLLTRDELDREVPVEFLKVSGTLTTYIPIWTRVVLALSVRGGKIFPLVQNSVTPPVKRFFLGGSSSMRGFREDGLIANDQRQELHRQVNDCRALASNIGCTAAAKDLLAGRIVDSQGGELFALGKAELRFPAFDAVDMGVFFEAGNLWLGQPQEFTLRPVAGAGLRLASPFGPVALDFGVNLDRDALVNEPAFNVHFNIGLF